MGSSSCVRIVGKAARPHKLNQATSDGCAGSDPNLEPTAVMALEAIIGVAYARLSQEPF